MKDPVLKERFLSTPMAQEAIRALKRPAPSGPAGSESKSKRERRKDLKGSKGKSSGKGNDNGYNNKGGGKGKGKGATGQGCRRTTGDGKPICFRFNSAEGCQNDKCAFLHVWHLLRHRPHDAGVPGKEVKRGGGAEGLARPQRRHYHTWRHPHQLVRAGGG